MKTILTSLLLLSSTAVWAHGNAAHQAQSAIASALNLVQSTQPLEKMRLFQSVKAEKIAHETFAVTVAYTDQSEIHYVCRENEDVDPVVWACDLK